MKDETEDIRRGMVAVLNDAAAERAELESRVGKTWDTTELSQEFEVLGFMAPYVVVRRKSDGKKGSMLFQHSPRFYFGFEEA